MGKYKKAETASIDAEIQESLTLINDYRFGSGVRTEKKDAKVPGAGTYHQDLIQVHRKEAKKLPNTQRFKPLPNEKKAENWPSAAAYKLPLEKPKQSYSLGARFDEKRVPMYKK